MAVKYTDEMDSTIVAAVTEANGLATKEVIADLSDELDVPARSLAYRMRNVLELDVESTTKAPSFTADETETFLELADGTKTAEEIAVVMDKTPAQVRGKNLACKTTLAPSEKAEPKAKVYSDAEEVRIEALVEDGKFLEEIAAAMGREVNSIRGKLLSMKLKAPQRDHVAVKTAVYTDEIVADLVTRVAAGETLDQIVEATGLNVRGLKSKLGKMAKVGTIDVLPEGFGSASKGAFDYTDEIIEAITDFVGEATKTSAETAEHFNIPLASLRSKMGRLGLAFAAPEKAAKEAAE